ncbi:MAG: hypothetical protein H7A33_08425 [Deltaproteobacteria bacterium]|nr:hypothetical protein [Deltaproteobacteria bacterium]
MSNIPEITIGTQTISTDDLAEMYEDGTLYDVLEAELKDMNSVTRSEEVADVLEQIAEALDGWRDIEDELEDEIDEREDLDKSTSAQERELAEIDDLIDDLKDEIPDAIEEYALSIDGLYIASSEDLSLSPTSDYDNGDHIQIKLQGHELTGIFEEDEEFDGVNTHPGDLDGDGFETARDYEEYQTEQSQLALEQNQLFLLELSEYDIVQNIQTISESEGKYELSIYNSNNKKTITLTVSGLLKGTSLIFQTNNSNFMQANMPAAMKKLSHFGNDIDTVWDHENKTDETAQLAMINGYEDCIDEQSFIATYNQLMEPDATLPAASAYAYFKEVADDLFGTLNDPDAMNAAEAVSKFLQNINKLAPEDQASLVSALVMQLAKNQKENYFGMFFGDVSSLPALQSKLLYGEELSVNARAVNIFIEMHAPTAPDASGNMSIKGGMYGNTSLIELFYGNDGLDSAALQYPGWTNNEKTKEALELYNTLVGEVSWALPNNLTTQFSDNVDNEMSQDAWGISDLIQGKWANDVLYTATSYVSNFDSKGRNDGIDQKNYNNAVLTGLNVIAEMISTNQGSDIEELAKAILGIFNNPEIIAKAKWQEPVVGGIIAAIAQACPELLDSLCAIPSFANQVNKMLSSSNKKNEVSAVAVARYSHHAFAQSQNERTRQKTAEEAKRCFSA